MRREAAAPGRRQKASRAARSNLGIDSVPTVLPVSELIKEVGAKTIVPDAVPFLFLVSENVVGVKRVLPASSFPVRRTEDCEFRGWL